MIRASNSCVKAAIRGVRLVDGGRNPEAAEHPGALLRNSVLPALHLSVSQAARDLLVTRQTLHRILAGQAAITPDMAVRLEKFCGISSRFWLNRQQIHELARVSGTNRELLSRIPSHLLPTGVLKSMGIADG
jgi:addiction module HigA family antidote